MIWDKLGIKAVWLTEEELRDILKNDSDWLSDDATEGLEEKKSESNLKQELKSEKWKQKSNSYAEKSLRRAGKIYGNQKNALNSKFRKYKKKKVV
jgi:hypothetical protein